MDESEAYDYGSFDTFEEAAFAAREKVDEFFARIWKEGMTINEMRRQYLLYGEEPVIRTLTSHPHPGFSAHDYADISAVQFFIKMQNK